MTRQSLIRIGAGVAVAGLVALTATPAFADSTTSTTLSTTSSSVVPRHGSASTGSGAALLAAIQAKANADIQARLTALRGAIGVLGGVKNCDVSPLVSTAQTDISMLTALQGTIDADTTAQKAHADAQTIFTQFRVFALVLPVDQMVRATCAINEAVTLFDGLGSKWSGLSNPAVTTLAAQMVASANASGALVSGLPGTLEGITPQTWDGQPTILKQYRSTLQTARGDLQSARNDARQIVALLHSGRGQGQSSVSSSTSSVAPTTSTAAAA